MLVSLYFPVGPKCSGRLSLYSNCYIKIDSYIHIMMHENAYLNLKYCFNFSVAF